MFFMEVVKLPHCRAVRFGRVMQNATMWPADDTQCIGAIKPLCRTLFPFILKHLESVALMLPFIGNVDSVCANCV